MRYYYQYISVFISLLVIGASSGSLFASTGGNVQCVSQVKSALRKAKPPMTMVSAPKTAGQAVRNTKEIQDLTIMSLNCENLVDEHMRAKGAYASPRPPKTLEDLNTIGATLKAFGADIVVLQEVENLEILNEFLRKVGLRETYEALLLEGNDPSGIDTGFLVRKDLPMRFELESHRRDLWVDPVDSTKKRVHARDFPVLKVFFENNSSQKPDMLVGGVHKKSMRDRAIKENVVRDPMSKIWRQAESQAMVDVLQKYRTQFGQDIPIVLAGDFNSHFGKDEILNPILENYKDSLVVSRNLISKTDAPSHISGRHNRYVSRLDGILLSPSLIPEVLSAGVGWYIGSDGLKLTTDDVISRGKKAPSDHFPVLMKMKVHMGDNAELPRAAGGP